MDYTVYRVNLISQDAVRRYEKVKEKLQHKSINDSTNVNPFASKNQNISEMKHSLVTMSENYFIRSQ